MGAEVSETATRHRLKTVQPYFDAVATGAKTAELRKEDRVFQVGDLLLLDEWTGSEFTGRYVVAEITHITRGPPWFAAGYCMLSFRKLN